MLPFSCQYLFTCQVWTFNWIGDFENWYASWGQILKEMGKL